MQGDLPACEWVIKSVQRHVDDLKNAPSRGLRYDREKAAMACNFFHFLSHSKGEWAGRRFDLEGWQAFIVSMLFGWVHDDTNLRRFRESYSEIPRKNGKSTLAAGIALKLLIADGEPGAEIYSAATKRDQAKIVFSEAKNMVKRSPSLKKRLGVFQNNIHHADSQSKFEPLGADADSTDGLNIHGALNDEVHAWKNRLLYDVMTTATGARRQPLIFNITTAGFNKHTVCFELHEYLKKVLDNIVPDDSFFGIIHSIDDGDHWAEPSSWAKANPNLDISVKFDDVERKSKKAQNSPLSQNAFRRLHLDEWTEQATRFLDLDAWDACKRPYDIEMLAGRECIGALDLANTIDIAAFVLVFDIDGEYFLLPFFFVPENNVDRRAKSDRVPYDVWIRQGFIDATPGNVIDYDYIRKKINDLGKIYNIKEIPADRWNATQIITQLDGDGFTIFPFGQGFASMSAPTKDLLTLTLGKKIRHNGNPVMRWMASNLAVTQDAAGNQKPAKDKSSEKIDGMVALVMALGRLRTQTPKPTPGIRTL